MKARFFGVLIVQFVALVFVFASVEAAQQVFLFVSESAVFDATTQQVMFTIEFNQVPDFSSVDSFGRQANSFQYFIVSDPNRPYPANFAAIIRGEEIHHTQSEIRIRNATPSDPDPAAGGWGAIRGTVPYRLNGNVLTFSVPLQVLSDQSRGGTFEYQLESYHFGTSTKFVESRATQSDGTPGTIRIDINPGNSANTINPRNQGVIPVAILTTPNFKASTIAPLSVRFGPGQAREVHGKGHMEDVDGDGDRDLVLHFHMQETGIECGATSAILSARTVEGQSISGKDTIKTVGCK